MLEADSMRLGIRSQMHTLESLVSYLEDRGELGAKDYLYCESKLHETLKHLKRLERQAGAGRPDA